MEWIDYASYFFGGAFLTNAIPHFVSGLTGRAFQSPFAKPRGQGLSSSTVNVLWGFVNLAAGYVLVCRVGIFDLRSTADVLAQDWAFSSWASCCRACLGGFTAATLRGARERSAGALIETFPLRQMGALASIIRAVYGVADMGTAAGSSDAWPDDRWHPDGKWRR